MTINSKTTLIAILSIAVLSIAIASVQSIMTAQQPVKTLAASPQGEWVVLSVTSGGNQVSSERVPQADPRHRRNEVGVQYMYSVKLYHTGTGKVRHVTWPSDVPPDAANMIVIESR
jgi:invasion protein IalB